MKGGKQTKAVDGGGCTVITKAASNVQNKGTGKVRVKLRNKDNSIKKGKLGRQQHGGRGAERKRLAKGWLFFH